MRCVLRSVPFLGNKTCSSKVDKIDKNIAQLKSNLNQSDLREENNDIWADHLREINCF